MQIRQHEAVVALLAWPAALLASFPTVGSYHIGLVRDGCVRNSTSLISSQLGITQ